MSAHGQPCAVPSPTPSSGHDYSERRGDFILLGRLDDGHLRRQPHNHHREHPVGTRRNQEHADRSPLPLSVITQWNGRLVKCTGMTTDLMLDRGDPAFQLSDTSRTVPMRPDSSSINGEVPARSARRPAATKPRSCVRCCVGPE